MHLATGFVGTAYIAHVLNRFGYLDTAYDLLLQDTCPSWLYAVTQGATTIWERWDGQRPDGTFQTPDMNSFNHYAYGAIGEWLYKVVAGLQIDPAIDLPTNTSSSIRSRVVDLPQHGQHISRSMAKSSANGSWKRPACSST